MEDALAVLDPSENRVHARHWRYEFEAQQVLVRSRMFDKDSFPVGEGAGWFFASPWRQQDGRQWGGGS